MTTEEFYNYLNSTDDTLEHFGIKGMKWGVRRTQAQLGNVSNEPPKKTKQQVTAESVAREKSHTATYENRASMTDEELRNAINRINLENQLKEASSKAAQLTDTRSEGRKLVDSMKNDIKKDLQAAAKDTATAYIKNKLDEIVTGGKSTNKVKPSDLINEREKKAAEAKKQAEESKKRQAEAQKQAAKMQAEREAKEERAKAEKQAKTEKRAAEKMMEEAMVQGTKQLITKYTEKKLGDAIGTYDPETGKFDWN